MYAFLGLTPHRLIDPTLLSLGPVHKLWLPLGTSYEYSALPQRSRRYHPAGGHGLRVVAGRLVGPLHFYLMSSVD